MMAAVLMGASLEGAIVAALIWAAIKWLPRLSPATRAALWWCAAAKFLVALMWVSPLELPVLPPAAGASPAFFAAGAGFGGKHCRCAGVAVAGCSGHQGIGRRCPDRLAGRRTRALLRTLLPTKALQEIRSSGDQKPLFWFRLIQKTNSDLL